MMFVLESTLKRLEGSEEFPADDANVQELRRWLLLTIGDLKEKQNEREREESHEAECA